MGLRLGSPPLHHLGWVVQHFLPPPATGTGDLGCQHHPRAGVPPCWPGRHKSAGKGLVRDSLKSLGSSPCPLRVLPHAAGSGPGQCHPDIVCCHRNLGLAVPLPRHQSPRVEGHGDAGQWLRVALGRSPPSSGSSRKTRCPHPGASCGAGLRPGQLISAPTAGA